MTTRDYFHWTDECYYKLAIIVSKHSGYKKTDMTMKDKWTIINNEVKKTAGFERLDITSEALKNTFKLKSTAILKELGINDDTANLSALPESPTELQKLIVNMAEENALHKVHTAKLAQKKQRVHKSLLTHEMEGLQQQGHAFNTTGSSTDTTISTITPVIKQEPGSEGSSSNSGKTFSLFAGLHQDIINLADDEEDLELERQEKRQKLRHDEEEHQLRMREREANLKMQQVALDIMMKNQK